MNKIVIVGAGRLGKGFIGEVFEKAGWKITFIDKDNKVIEMLNENNEYHVTVHKVEKIDYRIVKGFKAYTWNDEGVVDSIIDTDLIMMALYPEDFPDAFSSLKPALYKRLEKNPLKKLSIVCLTNKNHLMKNFKEIILNSESPEFVSWYKNMITLSDSIIRRSTDANSNHSIDIHSTAVLSLLIEKPLNAPLEKVEWMEPVDNLELLKDLKVFSVNGPHVTSAFAGQYYGYSIWNDAMNDKRVSSLVEQVSLEINQAILNNYPVSKQDLNNLSVFPVAKGNMEDTILRIAKDPIRKLGKHDRLVGIAEVAEKSNLSFDALSRSIALGYLYKNEDDEKSLELQKVIQNYGIESAIQKISEIEPDTILFKKVLNYYKQLQTNH